MKFKDPCKLITVQQYELFMKDIGSSHHWTTLCIGLAL